MGTVSMFAIIYAAAWRGCQVGVCFHGAGHRNTVSISLLSTAGGGGRGRGGCAGCWQLWQPLGVETRFCGGQNVTALQVANVIMQKHTLDKNSTKSI